MPSPPVPVVDRQTGNTIAKGAPDPAGGPTRDSLTRERPVAAFTGRLFVGFGIILILALLIGAGVLITQLRSKALADAEREMLNLDLVLAEQTARLVQSLDLVLITTVEKMRTATEAEIANGKAIHIALRERIASMPMVRALTIFDETGAIRYSSRQHPPIRISVAARQPFIIQRDNPAHGLDISIPTRSLTDGLWSTFLTRRISGPHGEFKGIVTLVIDPGYFEEFYKAIDLGPGSVVALFRSDGTLLARYPSEDGILGQTFVSASSIFDSNAPVIDAESGRTRSPIDGVTRISSFRAVKGFPLVITVGTSELTLLAAWRREAIIIAICAATAAIMLALMLGAITRQLRWQTVNEQALRKSEARFRHINASLPGIVFQFRFTPHGNSGFTYISDRVREIYGIAPETIYARPNALLAPIHAEDRSGFEKSVAESRTGLNAWSHDYRIHRDDQVRWLRGTSISQKGPDGSIVSDGVFVDITELKEAEAALREARDKAEMATRTKSEFLANMSHELRTPLNAIIGFSEIIAKEMFGRLGSSKYIEYAQDIRRSGAHLLDVINDILDMSKIEAGRYDLDEQTIDLGPTINACLTMIRHRADEGGIELGAETERTPHLRADLRALKQVLLNLLSNAVKFTPRGGKIRVAWRIEGDGSLTISVADTGIGIPKESIDRILEPFQQVDTTISRKYEGTGLGLSISRSLIRLHGGTICIESTSGVGTTVTIRFPAERVIANLAVLPQRLPA
ncbi:MAG: PAS domain-containing protein [Rhodospirillales bacterium]|nr:PAS domain-containing protein [Rhodospirillales bacterium]